VDESYDSAADPQLSQLRRTYRLSGLDRFLYRSEPAWTAGTFVQANEEHGCLVLISEGIDSPEALRGEIQRLDRVAERFRLAIAKRIGCPLRIVLETSRGPSFDPSGVASAQDQVALADIGSSTVAPRAAPSSIEQVPEEAARWILTLTEARTFDAFPDEMLKRYYLLIEELKDAHGDALSNEQVAVFSELKWLRDFVSHPVCTNPALCGFIERELPSAVVSSTPLTVRFDRSLVEHRNFVGRYSPKAHNVAGALLDAAISALPASYT
jgi:hypothetical protein